MTEGPFSNLDDSEIENLRLLAKMNRGSLTEMIDFADARRINKGKAKTFIMFGGVATAAVAILGFLQIVFPGLAKFLGGGAP